MLILTCVHFSTFGNFFINHYVPVWFKILELFSLLLSSHFALLTQVKLQHSQLEVEYFGK